MSTVTRVPHGGHDQKPAPTRAQQKARALGLTSATGLVVGSMYQAMVLVLAGVIIYPFIKAYREDTGQVTPPAEQGSEA